MLQNAYFLAKIGADTAENEQHFAEIFGDFLRLTGTSFGCGMSASGTAAGLCLALCRADPAVCADPASTAAACVRLLLR